jgi:hypothetical protein
MEYCAYEILCNVSNMGYSAYEILCNLSNIRYLQCKGTIAECSIEMYSQSEDKQADCLSKNATIKDISLRIFGSFGLPELNYTALANAALVSVIAQYL